MIDMNAAALRVSEKVSRPFLVQGSDSIESYRSRVFNAGNKNLEQLKIIFLIDILAEMLSPAAPESKHDKIADYLAHVEHDAVLDWDEKDDAWLNRLHAFATGVIAVSDCPYVEVGGITQLLFNDSCFREIEARIAQLVNPKCEVRPIVK